MGRRKSLNRSVLDDSELEELNAMRIILAKAISDENTMAKDLPPLTKRLREMTLEYNNMKAVAEEEGRHVPDATPVSAVPHDGNVVEGKFNADAI